MRRITWPLIAAMLLAVTIAVPASASVDRIPVSLDAYNTGVVFDWGYWWDSGNMYHARDLSIELRTDSTGVEGHEYVNGYIVFESMDRDINCLTGKGTLRTEFTWTSDLDEDSGWIGTSIGHFSGYNCVWPPDYEWTIETNVVAHGFGQFEGLEYRAVDVKAIDDEGIPYHHSEGYVMVPG